jgi:DNA invertase Pin-like site-specific DNA recombinase
MTVCAIYLRTSAEESQGEFSMVKDLDLCRDYAAAQGYTIVGEFNDVRPLDELDRPGLNALREALAQHGGGVIIVPREDALAPHAEHRGEVAAALQGEQLTVEVAGPLGARATTA